jgi:hypothetical protein
MNESSPYPLLNETDLLEFALRLATYPNDPSTQNAQLLPSQIPEQLPADIPIPKDSHIFTDQIEEVLCLRDLEVKGGMKPSI